MTIYNEHLRLTDPLFKQTTANRLQHGFPLSITHQRLLWEAVYGEPLVIPPKRSEYEPVTPPMPNDHMGEQDA